MRWPWQPRTPIATVDGVDALAKGGCTRFAVVNGVHFVSIDDLIDLMHASATSADGAGCDEAADTYRSVAATFARSSFEIDLTQETRS